MKEKLDQVKVHIKEHKAVYIAAAVGVIVGGSIVGVISSSEVSVTTDSWKLIEFKWKSPTNNIVQTVLERRGHPGYKILCNQTGEVFASINRAADVMGLSASNLSKHLRGVHANVNGLTFENLGEMV